MNKNNRIDHKGKHRCMLEKHRRTIYATQSLCAICGKPVDFNAKAPNPLSPTLDHIIPISKGGHPSDIDNLQLAHWYCNRMKSDTFIDKDKQEEKRNKYKVVGSRNLPQSMDWANV